MTFLLQKFNAINRSRTEVRARNGLRSTASSIAFTGRLAVVCLLLAGFLGVGSAIAQTPPTVLRVGGGSSATVALRNADDSANNSRVHHYVINPGDNQVVVNNPLGNVDNGTFVAGTIATVTLNSDGTVTVTPISAGVLKIAGDTGVTATAAGTTMAAAPVLFEIMSANAPMVVGAADNEAAAAHRGATVALKVNDATTMQVKDINDMFSGGSGLGLTYRAQADPAQRFKGIPDNPNSPTADELRTVEVVTTSISGTTLTVALTSNAKSDSSNTDIWLFATDDLGEYARIQIPVTVGAAEQVHLAPAAMREGNRLIRSNDMRTTYEDTEILTGGFVDPTGVGSNNTPHYSVSFDKGTAVPNADADAYSVVTSALTVRVGQGASAEYQITDVRGVGDITLTVSATDLFICPAGYATGVGASPRVSTGVTADDCEKVLTRDADGDPLTLDGDDQKASIADYKNGASYYFKIEVISATTPKPTAALLATVTLVADGDPKMVNLADLDSEKDKAQPAFEVPEAGGDLTYTVVLDPAGVATASEDSSVITFSPIWHGDEKDKKTTATVTAENALGESFDSKINVVVSHAVSPVVNEQVALALAAGFTLMLKTTDRSMELDLANLMVPNPLDPTMMVAVGPVFMNPLPKSRHGSLPGGLLYEMEVEADHKSPESTKNNVITSAMSITLDPAKATLTITPYGANSAVVTLTGRNRAAEADTAMVTVPVTVVSCDGVDMSGPCAGVTVGTEGEELPTEVSLSQNYPNPFNPQTTIDYALPKAGDVSLVVYDMLGRKVDVLLDGPQAAGRHTVRFGANHLPNGTYVYRLVAADKTITRTMVLVK